MFSGKVRFLPYICNSERLKAHDYGKSYRNQFQRNTEDSCYNYIVYEWQSVIANNKLILKKIKGEPLTRTDLSSATDQAKNIYPKGYEIIDKYIKQLKKG